jgi:predicted nucleic acid-binding protein
MKVVLDLKVVMDTNVFVSGVFFSGPPYQILKAWQSGEFELVASQEILDEYLRVGEILAVERPAVDLKPIFNKFFACALASESKIIISGDKHLLKVSGYQGIEVLKPRDFVDKYLD